MGSPNKPQVSIADSNQIWKDATQGQFVNFRGELKQLSEKDHANRWQLLRLGYVNGTLQACVQGPFNEHESGRWVVNVPVPAKMADHLPDLLAKYVLMEADMQAGYDPGEEPSLDQRGSK